MEVLINVALVLEVGLRIFVQGRVFTLFYSDIWTYLDSVDCVGMEFGMEWGCRCTLRLWRTL